jgi:hypothetical protein
MSSVVLHLVAPVITYVSEEHTASGTSVLSTAILSYIQEDIHNCYRCEGIPDDSAVRPYTGGVKAPAILPHICSSVSTSSLRVHRLRSQCITELGHVCKI